MVRGQVLKAHAPKGHERAVFLMPRNLRGSVVMINLSWGEGQVKDLEKGAISLFLISIMARLSYRQMSVREIRVTREERSPLSIV